MLIFDERFARQYRGRPPPEFPLASPVTSIVRTLSGLSVYARIAAQAEARTGSDGGYLDSTVIRESYFHCASEVY